MSREGSLVKNTFILSIGTFLPKVVSFITLPILTGYLTKDEYGTYDLIITLASLFLPAVTLQIQTVAFRYLIEVREKPERIKTIISNIMAFLMPTSVLGVVILFFCLYKVDIYIRLLICLYYLADTVVNACRQIVRGLSLNRVYSWSAIISSIGQLIFVLVFVKGMRLDLFGATMALMLAEMISAVFLIIVARIHSYIDLRTVRWEEIKGMIQYSWPMVPNSMSMWVIRVSDRLVITSVMGLSANAIYAVANKIPQLLTLAQTTFTLAWQENASIVSKDEDAPKYYSIMFRMMFDLMAGSMMAVIACTPVLFRILVRGDYDSAYIHIPILLFSMFFYAMSAFLGGIYVAYMKTKSVGITTTIAAAINLIVDLLLIHHIGIFAASISTLVSYIFLFFYRMFDVKKIVAITNDKRHMFLIILMMLLVGGACMFRLWYLDVINCIVAFSAFFILNRSMLTALLKIAEKKLKRR